MTAALVSSPPMKRAAAAAKGALQRVKVWAWSCVCQRCGHPWTTLAEEPPRACPKCKRLHWQLPAGAKRRGRPPAPAA